MIPRSFITRNRPRPPTSAAASSAGPTISSTASRFSWTASADHRRLGNYDRWAGLDESAYRRQKRRWYERMVASAVRFVPDFRGAVVETDMFTPVTIRRFTGHEKRGHLRRRRKNATTAPRTCENLFVCGNDQGLVGIIGTILSGISIANRYLLQG